MCIRDRNWQIGKLDLAASHFETKLELELTMLDRVNDSSHLRSLMITHNKLGDILKETARLDAATEHILAGLKISKKLATIDIKDARAQQELIFSYYLAGEVFFSARKYTEAKDYYEKAISIFDSMKVRNQPVG